MRQSLYYDMVVDGNIIGRVSSRQAPAILRFLREYRSVLVRSLPALASDAVSNAMFDVKLQVSNNSFFEKEV